jgi:phosphate:Na+ symporter
LGLFFSGLRMVDANLRQATGRQLRTIISRLTKNPWVASIVGVACGALVQSSSGIVFIVVSLVTSGLTTVRRALPIVTWANVGCCALIFAAVLDLRVAILYMIGLAGVAFAFDRSNRRHALAALFGVGMLFYGIELIKLGAEPLKDLPAFSSLLTESHQSLFIALLGGAAFSFVTQSATAASIVAISVAQTGLVGAYPTMMAVYGANVGSTAARMVLSSALKGSARQITAFQDLFKILGTALFVAMLYLEAVNGVPLIRAFVERFSGRVDHQMALVALMFNLTMAVIFSATQPLIYRLLQWWLPPDEAEDLSRPQYLYDEALGEPATALDLLEKEQLRLVKRLRSYPAALREEAPAAARERARGLREPFVAVVARIEQFEHDLLNRQLGADESERLSGLQNRLSLIVYLEDSLRALNVAAESANTTERLATFLATYVEALDFVLLTLVEALDTGDAGALQLLSQMTEDRGQLVESIRQGYLTEQANVGAAERALLLKVTSIFERIMWMAQRLSHLVGSALDTPPRPTSEPAESADPAATDWAPAS